MKSKHTFKNIYTKDSSLSILCCSPLVPLICVRILSNNVGLIVAY